MGRSNTAGLEPDSTRHDSYEMSSGSRMAHPAAGTESPIITRQAAQSFAVDNSVFWSVPLHETTAEDEQEAEMLLSTGGSEQPLEVMKTSTMQKRKRKAENQGCMNDLLRGIVAICWPSLSRDLSLVKRQSSSGKTDMGIEMEEDLSAFEIDVTACEGAKGLAFWAEVTNEARMRHAELLQGHVYEVRRGEQTQGRRTFKAGRPRWQSGLETVVEEEEMSYQS